MAHHTFPSAAPPARRSTATRPQKGHLLKAKHRTPATAEVPQTRTPTATWDPHLGPFESNAAARSARAPESLMGASTATDGAMTDARRVRACIHGFMPTPALHQAVTGITGTPLVNPWPPSPRGEAAADPAQALNGYLRWYNHHRPHGSLAAQPFISRLSNVCGYSI